MSENTKHTPGPWKIYNSGGINEGHFDGYFQADILAGSDLIRIQQSVAGNTFPRLAANALLMAAAPELFAVAQMVVDYENGLKGGLSECVRAARAAIDKASA